jgi:hypothetical protein
MKTKIKEFKCNKGKMVEIQFLDHFERDIPTGSDYKDNTYEVKIYGRYLGDNAYYHFIEWLEQGSCVNVDPNKRIFRVLKNTIIEYKIFDSING